MGKMLPVQTSEVKKNQRQRSAVGTYPIAEKTRKKLVKIRILAAKLHAIVANTLTLFYEAMKKQSHSNNLTSLENVEEIYA